MILDRPPSMKHQVLIEYLVETTLYSEKFGVLPKAGGLLDQDAGWIDGMQKVLSAQAERSELEEKRRKKH